MRAGALKAPLLGPHHFAVQQQRGKVVHQLSLGLDHRLMHTTKKYSLRTEIHAKEMDVSRRILVPNTSTFIHFRDK